ncbi:hypothetical protein DFQ13_10118 [Actinokineospora spheciospongiae]|nr:hypothetical protein DFQ13_10118 [Actinokineospora spheciospongiae]
MPTMDALANSSTPNSSTPGASTPDAGDHAEETCTACPHPLDAHDPIALRFCRAGAAGGPARKCLCSGESAGMTYGNSNKGPINRKATSGR